MQKIVLYLFILLPFFCFAQDTTTRGGIVVSQVTPTSGTTHAIVIGISSYKEVEPLKFADKDASVFAEFLLNKNGMALDSANVKLYLNENATLKNIGNALSDIYTRDLKKGDKIIFFFAGHGDYDANIMKDQALLLLHGAPAQNYFQNIFSGDFISTADLNAKFIDPMVKKGCDVMLFIDACHATGLNQSLSGGTEGGKITTMALQNMTSTVKIYSCKASQLSLESDRWGGGRGLFSYVLMEALYGLADADNNKIVTFLELQRYLEDNIPKLAAPYNQFPIVKVENSDFPFATVNQELLQDYKNSSTGNNQTPAPVVVVNEKEVLEQKIDSLEFKKLYQDCNEFIQNDQLDQAYVTFIQLAKYDSSSEVSLQLRRNLSEALQQKTGVILNPLLKDISNWSADNFQAKNAEKDLEKAADLLGKSHILYSKLQARRLFLKAQMLDTGNENDINAAIDYLEQSIRLEPSAPYSYFTLARRYHKKNELEKARSNFDIYVNLIPHSAWAYNNRGWVYYDLKDYEPAISDFNKAIELKPEYDVAYNNAGNAYSLLGKYEDAIRNYKKSIELSPENPITYNNLGNAYSDLKNYAEAVVYIKKSLELRPDNASAYINLGRAYLYLDKNEDAIINYKKAIELRPGSTTAYRNLATASIYVKDYTEAISCYRKLLELQPNCDDCNYMLFRLQAVQNEVVESLSYLAQALQKGFTDIKKLANDIDIKNIRTLPQFKTLLEKHFSKENLDQFPGMFKVDGN